MSKIKVIANYLPQFHVIPENSKWWGENFTDWVAVKKSEPLYLGHMQPRVPLNENYYSLDDVEAIRWQASLAKKYGIYGFGIYHYWFSSKQILLQKPAELLQANKDIDIHYCFLWDNTSWTRTWSKSKLMNDWAPNFDKKTNDEEDSNGILAELIYGDESEWKKHFLYLLKFFKDDRYIKIDNKPIFGIFQPRNDFKTIQKMVKYWDTLAKENGFAGMICMSKDNWQNKNLEYKIRYAPFATEKIWDSLQYRLKKIKSQKADTPMYFNYDKMWKNIIKYAQKSDRNTILSGFVDFDDTPRRVRKARIIRGASPKKFGEYMYELMKIAQKQAKELVFVTAWNEWGESAYLEPDVNNGYQYIEALGNAIAKINQNSD